MRVVSFLKDQEPGFGLVVDNGIVDCGRRLGQASSLRTFLQTRPIEDLAAYQAEAPDYGLNEIRYLPLIPDLAAKILCIGINYRPHMLEMGREPPEYPLVFVRFGNSLVGHNEALIRPRASEKFDYEGELAVVIGKRARHVSRENALDYVAGYSCFNDANLRDFQRHTSQFTAGKNFYRSGSFGPWLVTRDEVPDIESAQLETRLNGTVVQSESIGELHFSIGILIEYISTWTELVPGDVIATGTPGGVGAGRKPPLWMRAGDLVEVEISGLGCLSNRIVDEDAP